MIHFNTVLVILSCFASGRAQIEDPLVSDKAQKFFSSLDYEARRPSSFAIVIIRFENWSEFDARENWPKCEIIQWIRNQWDCHCACFVFALVSMIADRLCIATDGINQTELSAYDAMACCSECASMKGDPRFGKCLDTTDFTIPIDKFLRVGLASGGDYNTPREKGCLPITSRRIEPTDIECSSRCVSNTSLRRSSKTSYLVKHHSDIAYIQQEIYINGPVVAVLFVDDEFRNYKKGVYKGATKLNLSDFAAVKILGWGVEGDVPYWLAANTMGTDWGDKGLVKILRDERVVRFVTEVDISLPKISTTTKAYTSDWSDNRSLKNDDSEWKTDEEDQNGENKNNSPYSQALENYTVLIVVTFVVIFLLA